MGDCCSDTMKYAGRVAVGTVTARAVNEGINAGINKYKQHQNQKQNNNNKNNNNNNYNNYNYNNNNNNNYNNGYSNNNNGYNNNNNYPNYPNYWQTFLILWSCDVLFICYLLLLNYTTGLCVIFICCLISARNIVCMSWL